MTFSFQRPSTVAERRGHLDVDGSRLEYRWLGPPPDRAPTVVFLHEGLGSALLWKDLPDQVAERSRWGVLCYSRRGYGASDRKPAPWPRSYLHDEAIDVLPRVLEVVGVRRPVLVGHSDGGSIALIAAATGLDVAGVVAMAPHVLVEPRTLAGVRGARQSFEEGKLRDHLRRHHGDNVDGAFRGWCDAWLRFGEEGWDVRPLLPGITAPVLVIQGDDDEYGTRAQIEAVRDAVSGPVEARLLRGCRHLMYRDQPLQVVGAILDMLAWAEAAEASRA
ncbi:MAG: alpha/beta hydrolase [Pseudomonadota bacterium]